MAARGLPAVLRPGGDASVSTRIAWLVMCGILYGAVMGTFGGFAGDRFWQVVFSAVKVPMLLGVSFALTLPSFFVINSLLGLRDDFAEVLRAVARTQAAAAIILAALAPYTAVWYLTSGHYNTAILFNAVMFGIASLSGQVMLRRAYQPLIAKNPRHRLVLRTWMTVYAFVGVQMGWVLRPFIGDPGAPTRFFREEAWGNAYVMIWAMIGSVVQDWLR